MGGDCCCVLELLLWNQDATDSNTGMFQSVKSQPNTVLVPHSEFPGSHTGVSCITSTRGMFALFKRHTSNENDLWSSARLLLPESPGRLPKTVFSQRHRTGHLGKTDLWCVSVAALMAARLKALI